MLLTTMRILVLPFLAVLITIPGRMYAGDIKGNGGDLIYCKEEVGMEFSGYFVLDYLAFAANEAAGQSAVVEDIDIGMMFVEKRLLEIHKELDQFYFDTTQISIGPKIGSKHIWRSAKNGLSEINDEQLARKLPKNCYSAPDNNILTLHQVVVRQQAPEMRGVIFNFDKDMMSKIENDSTQWSFLMTHEWLWEHCGNAECVRTINWYLHSHQFVNDSAAEVLNQMANMGFVFNSPQRPKNSQSVLRFSNELRPRYTEIYEPNNRRQFELDRFIVIDPRLKKVQLFNETNENLVIHLFESFTLCRPKEICGVDIMDYWEFPIQFFVEREANRDPIWDSKVMFLFR